MLKAQIKRRMNIAMTNQSLIHDSFLLSYSLTNFIKVSQVRAGCKILVHFLLSSPIHHKSDMTLATAYLLW
jgi:hypothetical protein